MSLKVDNKNTYFIPAKNKNSLNLYSVEDLFQNDFEIMVKVKVDWNNFPIDDSVSGIVAKNGQHMGLFAFTNWVDEGTETNTGIQAHTVCEHILMAKIWTEENEEIVMKDLTIKVGEALTNNSTMIMKTNVHHLHNKIPLDSRKFIARNPDYILETAGISEVEIYTLKLTHNLNDKKITFTCDDKIQEHNYTGKIRDYTDSMLWFGCSMGMGDEWNQYFYGEFLESYISVKDGYKIFESDFTQVTEFKAFDKSWNGNHLVKFDEANIV
jgi:hypothetical protein